MGKFSGEPLTRWKGPRIMILQEAFYFIDDDGTKWEVPVNAEINGATIPDELWSVVGAPYVGTYRKASVVHDYHVGEGNNPDVTHAHRRKADKMFYQACRAEGSGWAFARTLYLGVSLGSWSAAVSRTFTRTKSIKSNQTPDILDKYNEMAQKLDSFEEDDFDALEKWIDAELTVN